jgi:hypothetical protein
MGVAVKENMQILTERSVENIGVAKIPIVGAAAAVCIVVNGPDAQPACKFWVAETLLEPNELRFGAETVVAFVCAVFGIYRSIVAFIHGGIQPGDDDAKVFVDEK